MPGTGARSALAQAALVAALTAALYSIGLSASPPHLTHDEIKFALQAKSIADTGRDINGRLLPLYFTEPGFSVGRDPLCIYFTAALLTILPFSEQTIRLATALVGAASVGLMFVLARLVLARTATAWLVAGVLALTPTYYIHSRLALSVVYPVPFTLLWLIALRQYLQHRQPWIACATGAVLGLGVYSYLAAAVMMPLYLGGTLAALAAERDWRGIKAILAAFIAMLAPIVVWQVVEPERYANILTAYRLYDPSHSSAAQELRDVLGASALVARVNVFWDAFNPNRLFFTGESSLQISTREVGSLLTPVAVFLAVGLRRLLRPPRTTFGWLVILGLVTAPLPAVIMLDVEIRRWLMVLPFVALIVGFGIERMMEGGGKTRWVVVALSVLLALQFAAFSVDYFGSYRERASIWFGGNIRAALERLLDETRRAPPSLVYISNDIPWVEAYWRFYAKKHGQHALLERTQYLEHQAEIPRATGGAFLVTPAPDASAAAALTQAGWRHEVVADLDGKPSLALSRPAAP